MRLSTSSAIVCMGVLWLLIGLFLLMKGLNLLVFATHAEHFGIHQVWIARLAPLVGGSERSALILIFTALLIGLVKARFVLVKTIKRVVERILSFAPAIPWSKLFSTRYLLLMGLMIAMGISLRFLGLPADVHGLIDVAIGSALVNGSMIYFRLAILARAKRNDSAR